MAEDTISAGTVATETGPAGASPRQRWMAVLARAGEQELEAGLARLVDAPPWRVLRGPESGAMMVRGRIGGGGDPFNLGEMTVTRCTVRLDSGEVGHAYVAGRAARKAELAAAADALLQGAAWNPKLMAALVEPLARAQAAKREAEAAKAAATRVQFFTMQTMRS